jgi:hypothetical protein
MALVGDSKGSVQLLGLNSSQQQQQQQQQQYWGAADSTCAGESRAVWWALIEGAEYGAGWGLQGECTAFGTEQ